MKKKLFFLLAVILISAFAVTLGAYLQGEPAKQDGKTIESNQTKTFDSYYAARVKNVGNNSEVVNLLNLLGAGDFGEYTIALQTKTEPYGLTIIYSKLKNGVDEEKLKTLYRIDYAYYALALIDNLSTIDVNYKTYNYKLSVDDANLTVNGKIKDFGSSSKKLKELYKILNPND